MQPLTKRVRGFFTLTWLGLFLILGCSLIAPSGEPTSETLLSTANPNPSTTPFQPSEATPTPGVLRLWATPALPVELLQTLTSSLNVGGRRVELIDEGREADLRITSADEPAVTTWVFALVTPFASTLDGMSMEELGEQWRGESSQPMPIYIPVKDSAAIVALFGGLPSDNVILIDALDLVQELWARRPALAIVPFEELAPRLKVLRVEGISPIDKGEDLGEYPLQLRFAFQGDGQLTNELLATLSWPRSNRDPGRFTDVIMTGVTALTRATAWTMEQKGLHYPADEIGDRLRNADFTHVSNEVSFLSSCPPPTPIREGLIFCSSPDYVELLDFIGVDLIELTGNHIKDFGEGGLVETLAIYREKGWEYFGGGADLEDSFNPVLIEHNGNRLAFLGCNYPGPPAVWATADSPGATPCDWERLFQTVRDLRDEGYLPIFTFQWSEFYQARPPRLQIERFQEAADAGAVIVSGSQAHQPQAFALSDSAFIHYGVGNLFFDQMWSTATRQEFADRHVFYDGRYISTELITLFLEDFAQPRPMTEEERVGFLEAIFAASGW